MKAKTAIEHFRTFPQPYRDEAIKELKKIKSKVWIDEGHLFDRPTMAIIVALNIGNSVKGADYWHDFMLILESDWQLFDAYSEATHPSEGEWICAIMKDGELYQEVVPWDITWLFKGEDTVIAYQPILPMEMLTKIETK